MIVYQESSQYRIERTSLCCSTRTHHFLGSRRAKHHVGRREIAVHDLGIMHTSDHDPDLVRQCQSLGSVLRI